MVWLQSRFLQARATSWPVWMRAGCVLVLAWPGLGMVRGDEVERGSGDQVLSIDFRQQIQPLLSRDCFACHGPDEATRQADLRLDLEADAKQSAIVAGDVETSPLLERIFAEDVDEIMPPPESGHQLTAPEKQLLKQWIAEGAHWQSHWAFDPIKTPEVPASAADWGLNAIDAFVAQQQKSQGLQPSPPADKATLLKRLYLDLVGVPPTPQQRDRFLADNSPEAYEHVVDELLDSPHYGEQMAVAWLDAARFADTNGYQNDFNRSMWPWRDWVIDAFNRNLPYDQFIVEQIAGDLLPNPTPEQLIATGFNRNNRSVTEGGVIEEEWRIENGVDRVETTAAAFLGLTLGCARCHDHKYDPISQKEFYQFFAFFNNIDEAGVYYETRGNVGPQLTVPTAEQSARLDELTQQIAAARGQLSTVSPENLLQQWSAQAGDPQRATLPTLLYQFTQQQSTQPANELPRGSAPASTSFTLPGTADSVGPVPQPNYQFASQSPFTWAAWVQGDARGAIFSQMNEDASYRGVDGLILGDGKLKIHLVDQWPQNAIAVVTQQPLPPQQWHCVTVTYDGTSKAAGLHVYFDGNPIAVDVEQDGLTGTLATEVPFKIGQRFKSEFLRGELGEFQLYGADLPVAEVLSMIQQRVAQHYQAGLLSAAAPEVIAATTTYVSQINPDPAQEKLNELQAEHDRQYAAAQTTMIMRDRPEYRETFLLKRGQYDLPETNQALWPTPPTVLPPLADGQPLNRLGLATWMVDDRNPLVARVAVNRAWMKFFGRGLVETPDNFGIQGAPPTHPWLLDWLSDDFRKSGWDLKRLLKQIVMSATYQQSSTVTQSALEADPNNRYYSRGPRYRMNAEQVRDAALSRAGLLVEKQGGPSVYPYQPAGLWDELAGGANGGPYLQANDENLYRRSLYTFRKRTVSHPLLATFDAPSWETCQLKRSRTNTPLQALALLNDITYVEAARSLAQRMLLETIPQSKDSLAQADLDAATIASIRLGFDLVALRQPTDSELKTLVEGYQSYLQYYQEQPDQAVALLQMGQSQADPQVEPTRLAAMTSVASILLNLDEALTKE